MTIKEIKEKVPMQEAFSKLLPTYKQGDQILSKVCPCGKETKQHHCALFEDKFIKCFTADCGKAFDQIDLYKEVKSIDTAQAIDAIKQDFSLIEMPKRKQAFIDEKEAFEYRINKTSNFHKFCTFLGIPPLHLADWQVGTSKQGNTVFLEKDLHGNYWNYQQIKYLENGKRQKEPKQICFSKKQTQEEKYEHLPYGFHLLDKDKPTYIVEGNKTAVIASFFYPDFNFLACQAANGLTEQKVKMIVDAGINEVIWLCDADDAGRENSSLDNLLKFAPLKSYVLDLFKDNNEGYDLADAIIDGLRPDLRGDIVAVKSYLEKFEPVKKEDNKFWEVIEKGKKTVLSITKPLIIEFLENEGFCHVLASNEAKQQHFELIHVKDNICLHIQRKGIIDYVINFVEKLPNTVERIGDVVVTKTALKKLLIETSKEVFSQANLDLIKTRQIEFLQDTLHYSYKFYKNCFVKISKDEIQTFDYSKLPAHIWRNQILKRDFKLLSDAEIEDSIWANFLTLTQGNMGRDNTNIDIRLENLHQCIGYLLHNYKSSHLNKIIFATDHSFEESEQGGNGKSIVFKTALEKMMPVCYIDGKNWKKDSSFPFQLLESYHKLIVINDLRKDFDIEQVFNVATDDMVSEKKNQSAYVIPFKESPKLVLTGNNTLKGDTNAHLRRLQIVEFSSYFNKTHTPFIEFGKALFDDFTDFEWLQFDNCMLQFLQKWLATLKFSDFAGNYDLKKLYNEVPQEICDFFEKTFINPDNGLVNTNSADGMYFEILKEDLLLDYNDLYIVKNEKNLAKAGQMTKYLKKFLNLRKIKPKKYTDKRFPYLMSGGNKEKLIL